MRKVYIIGNDREYVNWMQSEIVDAMEEADFVVGTGGEDVHPKWYEEPLGEYTYTNYKRDVEEYKEWVKAINLKKPLVGICRSSQFLCVLAGGKLVQDQRGQPSIHNMRTYNNKVIRVTSSHHQAQFPFVLNKSQYHILGWTEGTCIYHLDGNGNEMNPEVEVEDCYYPEINALAIQSHPEYLHIDHPTVKYYQELLNNFLNGALEKELQSVDSIKV